MRRSKGRSERPRRPLLRRGVQQRELSKVAAVEASIAREQAVGANLCVGADEKVRDHPVASPARPLYARQLSLAASDAEPSSAEKSTRKRARAAWALEPSGNEAPVSAQTTSHATRSPSALELCESRECERLFAVIE
jgi:hypothetical protein